MMITEGAAGRVACFCWEGPERDSKIEHPMEDMPSKGRSDRKGVAGGGVSSE